MSTPLTTPDQLAAFAADAASRGLTSQEWSALIVEATCDELREWRKRIEAGMEEAAA